VCWQKKVWTGVVCSFFVLNGWLIIFFVSFQVLFCCWAMAVASKDRFVSLFILEFGD
jgi:hypothetical protein